MSQLTVVSITIEPSDNNGYATTVKPQGHSATHWWKWYQSKADAFDDAEKLGYADVQVSLSGNRYVLNKRSVLKPETTVDSDQLIRFGFELRG
jgi:hypothetical protein